MMRLIFILPCHQTNKINGYGVILDQRKVLRSPYMIRKFWFGAEYPKKKFMKHTFKTSQLTNITTLNALSGFMVRILNSRTTNFIFFSKMVPLLIQQIWFKIGYTLNSLIYSLPSKCGPKVPRKMKKLARIQ